MRSSRTCILLCVLLFVVIALPAHADSNLSKDWFPLEVGYWWVYDLEAVETDVIIKVTGKEKVGKYNCFVVEMGDTKGNLSSIELYCKTSDEVLIIGEKDIKTRKNKIFDSPREYLKIPLKEGATWNISKYLEKNKVIRETKKVMAVGDIKVPAGKFSTLKVINMKKEDGKDRISLQLWYSRGVGVVKMILRSEDILFVMSLKEYNLKKMDFSKKQL